MSVHYKTFGIYIDLKRTWRVKEFPHKLNLVGQLDI